MNALGEILAAADVALDVDVDTRDGLVAFAAELVARNHALPAPEVKAALTARETLGCTALGHAVALPHARMPGLAGPVAAFVRTKEPIAFGAVDGRPVSLFLVLLVPAQAAEEHLKLLAEAAALLNDRSFRVAVRAANNAGEVSRLFAQWPIAEDGT